MNEKKTTQPADKEIREAFENTFSKALDMSKEPNGKYLYDDVNSLWVGFKSQSAKLKQQAEEIERLSRALSGTIYEIEYYRGVSRKYGDTGEVNTFNMALKVINKNFEEALKKLQQYTKEN